MILDGAALAKRRRAALGRKIGRSKPGLGIILATDDPATLSYVAAKRTAATEIGFSVTVKDLGKRATRRQLVTACRQFNRQRQIDGYLVQLPLPGGINPEEIFAEVDPAKDADGLTPTNLGTLMTREERVVPATPKGILSLLEAYKVPLKGTRVVVVGKGTLTGLPLATLLANRLATVTVCDKFTKDLAAQTKRADLLVVATGRPGLISGPMVKPGAVVVDVGTTLVRGQLRGDVDFDAVRRKAKAITPVPGGVGPMTVVSLLENVYQLSRSQR